MRECYTSKCVKTYGERHNDKPIVSIKFIMIHCFLFPALDRVSCTNELTKTIPGGKVAATILFVTLFWNTNSQGVLYHCQIDDERRTFLKGKWASLGLSEYSNILWFYMYITLDHGDPARWMITDVISSLKYNWLFHVFVLGESRFISIVLACNWGLL